MEMTQTCKHIAKNFKKDFKPPSVSLFQFGSHFLVVLAST
jgi:hypothetical protein